MIAALARPLLTWWDGLTDAARVQWTGVAFALLLYGIHSIFWSHWLIEDAAISYSYALHAATGEGWVVYPGGEPVEGFSNPTWTALLTALRFGGISPFLAGGTLGLVLGAATLPLAFLWAREATESDGLIPVLAPVWLACSPQFTMWATGGLENALWSWLLAVGGLAFLRELKHGGLPWSALPMGLLACTRPEGPLYVAAMAFAGAGLSLRNPRALGRITAFVTAAASIWAAWFAYRYLVFGWPFPNTYYAKLHDGHQHFQPWTWRVDTGTTGWPYLRSWGAWSTWGFLLPLLPVAATGWKGWRGQVGLTVGATLFLVLLPGADWLVESGFWPLAPEPTNLVKARVVLIVAAAFALPWLGTKLPGARARILAWCLAAVVMVFIIRVGGDWMAGHRWISLGAVPLSVMLADLVHTCTRAREWADPERARQWIVLTVGGFPVVAAVVHTATLIPAPDITPFDLSRRATYMNQAQARLHIDHPTTYDIDMGGIMWWSDDELIDAAGLVDVSMARHAWEQPFMREYIFRERRPHFMHAHGIWRTKAGIDAHVVFGRDYVRIPDYITPGGGTHTGNHVRRDLFAKSAWEGSADPVQFGGAIRLEGLQTPSPVVLAGGTLYIEVGWARLVHKPPNFRAVAFLSNGEQVHSWELPPAYDWVMPLHWREREVIHGYHSLSLPADLRAGDWDLGIVLLAPGQPVLPADRPAEDPVFARGEVRWKDRVTVADPATVLAAVDTRLAELDTAAKAGRCKSAEDALQLARRHLPEDHPDQPWANPAHHTTLARCFATLATTLDDRAAETAIARARQWDHRDPEVRAIGKELADTWQAMGDAAWAEDKAGPAYGAWRRTLAADPHRPFVRKRLELARDIRLGIHDPDDE